MGWMGREQVRLLLESGGLGLLLGVLFDVCCALSRACGRRRWLRFGVDAAFGVPAALLTFYGALAIMDGRMHPLLFAGLHLTFAFPFIRKILYMFSFYNTGFLIWMTVISFLVFALLYALVYKKTSNTYYKIVSK